MGKQGQGNPVPAGSNKMKPSVLFCIYIPVAIIIYFVVACFGSVRMDAGVGVVAVQVVGNERTSLARRSNWRVAVSVLVVVCKNLSARNEIGRRTTQGKAAQSAVFDVTAEILHTL